MPSQTRPVALTPSALGQAIHPATITHTKPLSPRHYKALSELLRYAAHIDMQEINEFLSSRIVFINDAIENDKNIELKLPPVKGSSSNRTLMQQYCDVVSTLYENAAIRPLRVDQLSAHVSAIENVFEHALSLWNTEGAAAHYLERPTSLLNGQSPLDIARESLDAAHRIVSFIDEAKQSLEDIEREAKSIRAPRPPPSIESVRKGTLELLGDSERANAFLNKPHPLLGDRVPIELANESQEGAARVDRLIRQAQANTAI